jgi:hypothetical protein
MKTTSGRRQVKLLARALKALLAQKQHTFMAGAEIFQNPNFNERWVSDQPIRKTLWKVRSQACWRSLPQPVPNASDLREHDAFGRRASDVGHEANGPWRLDDVRPELRAKHARCGQTRG